MDLNIEYLKIAANMLGDGDPGLLNYKLGEYLEGIAHMVQTVGGRFFLVKQ